jgi:hypothetical protein
MKQAFGEIVEGSLQSWKACCWHWDILPPFGSLLVTSHGSLTLFGVVAHVQTGSIDPGRYPFPYQKTEDELKREQPHIFALLQTLVSCITLGYQEENRLYYQLPPYPPKIHAFARQATLEELTAFFSNISYVHLLCAAAAQFVSREELALALLKYLADRQALTPEHVNRFISAFSSLSGHEYRTLKFFLQRVEALLSVSSPESINQSVSSRAAWMQA